LPGLQVSREVLLKAENDFRKSIIETIQTITGIFTASGLVFTIYYAARNVSLAERTAAENLRATLDGKLTDRFAKAIELLSSDSVPVRVGAIYALERIARDSVDDHWPIMEISCAFLREKFPADQHDTRSARPEDARAVATLLRRRERGRESPNDKLDLSSTNVSGLNFECAVMRNANFDGSYLIGTIFEKADLSGATFANAKCKQAIFRASKLVKAFLNGADFTRASMENADILDATTDKAVFSNVIGPIRNDTPEQRSAASIWSMV
jgi:hypothetical protein